MKKFIFLSLVVLFIAPPMLQAKVVLIRLSDLQVYEIGGPVCSDDFILDPNRWACYDDCGNMRQANDQHSNNETEQAPAWMVIEPRSDGWSELFIDGETVGQVKQDAASVIEQNNVFRVKGGNNNNIESLMMPAKNIMVSQSNNRINIHFTVLKQTVISCEIVNLQGQLINQVFKQDYQEGEQAESFLLQADLPDGIYFVRLMDSENRLFKSHKISLFH